MTKSKELTNEDILEQISKKQKEIKELKSQLKPAVLPKQATLAECNALARKAKTKPVKVDPALHKKQGEQILEK